MALAVVAKEFFLNMWVKANPAALQGMTANSNSKLTYCQMAVMVNFAGTTRAA